ncbi:MAG: hypothetical protein IKJ40_02000 [Bacteroidales bacterium]|nr:hypothetical protein [Bacteroidales bacterium]
MTNGRAISYTKTKKNYSNYFSCYKSVQIVKKHSENFIILTHSANIKSKKKENIYRAQTTGLQLAEQNKQQKMQDFGPKQTPF